MALVLHKSQTTSVSATTALRLLHSAFSRFGEQEGVEGYEREKEIAEENKGWSGEEVGCRVNLKLEICVLVLC